MHVTNVELIWILACAIVLVLFWRAVIMLLLCAMIGTALLGLVTAFSYFGH